VVKPDQVVLNLVLDIAAKTKDANLIQQIVKDLWEMGFEPHPEHYDAIRDL